MQVVHLAFRFALLLVGMLSLYSQELILNSLVRADADEPLRRLSAERAFRAVGLIPSREGAHFHVLLRHSLDGKSWSAVERVEVAHEGGTLYWIEKGARWVEIASSEDVRVVFIEPGEVRAVAWKEASRSVEPEIVNRAGWGCGAECAPRANPIFAPVTHLVVHHSAGGNQSSNWAAVVRSIWVLHVQGNGWNDIGYNYLIDPNGVAYEGRAGGDGVIGAHFSGVNTGTMGVCMIGTYSTTPASPAAIETLQRLLAWQAEKWKLDPSGQSIHRPSGLTLNVISGHRDAGLSPNASGATECPGNALYAYLPAVRRRVSTQVPACRIELARRNYCSSGEGAAFDIAFENPRNCNVGADIGVDWLKLEDGKLVVAANAGAARSAEITVGGQWIQIAQAAVGVRDLPCPTRGGVVNAASFDERPLGRGSIATVFGEDLWREGSATRVLINNNVNATVVGATPRQVNFLLPASIQPGSARLFVERGGIRSGETMFWVTEAAPAIFVAQNFSDGSVNSSSSPVRPGEALIAYLTGIGSTAGLPWQIEWDGEALSGLFLGATPGFVGLAQANLIVPANASLGTHRMRVSVSGVPSQEINVVVGR